MIEESELAGVPVRIHLRFGGTNPLEARARMRPYRNEETSENLEAYLRSLIADEQGVQNRPDVIKALQREMIRRR